ncbi:hypothetical protein K431DRAFT_209979, partial [Polychaeton citri CBS 116435]
PSADGEPTGDANPSKPKRVRTGCLTCRERHLKCDEALPHCNNCKKSNRQCKRGVRLNFIDTWVDKPPRIVTLFGTKDWRVDFHDESREIASEYVGGLARYKHIRPPTAINKAGSVTAPNELPNGNGICMDFPAQLPPSSLQHSIPLPPIHAIRDPHQPHFPDASSHQASDMSTFFDNKHRQSNPHDGLFQPHLPSNSGSSNGSMYQPSHTPHTVRNSIVSYNAHDSPQQDQDDGKREYLNSQEETLFMQVFVEEVGLWMDSMDPMKHFSRLLPFHSLSEPMLLNAFLACGARHLTLVNPAYTEEKALHYYDTATRYLLKNLQNPNRDTVICATTAVILNVYEIMSEKALQRMNHIAGARALIKECGWNARAQGIGAACFWLNVGLEVLSCLHFNWQCAWDPDDWGLEFDLSREQYNGREEVWTHKMLYIIAKVCNFRATIPRFQEPDRRAEQIRQQHRYEEWCRLKGYCDAWNNNIPRTMHPMSYLYPSQTTSKSAFPEVWLIKRTTIVARLFYHTAMLLLAQVNPYYKADTGAMAEQQTLHAQMICGIAAHVKDRGVASVAIRSLAHAAEVLTDRREQEEVLQIFDKINKETGWRIGFVYKELKEKWGWNDYQPSPEQYAQTHQAAREVKEAQSQTQRQQQKASAPSAASAMKRPPAGIPNPLYAQADFNLPQHPYQNVYVAP